EWAVQHESLHARLAGGAEQRDDSAHRIAQQSDARVGDALTGKGDHRLQLQNFLDSEGDWRTIAAGPAPIRIKDDVEPLAPERRRDPKRALSLSLVAAGDDHRLRRAGLPKKPRAEVDAVGGDELHFLVVGLELERREREVVEGPRLGRDEGSPV